MKLLFLDIDGVLNEHDFLAGGLCDLQSDKVDQLNRILRGVPDLRIVITSAWRYYVHTGLMTVQGLEVLLRTHGVNCEHRLLGVTDPDPETFVAERPYSREEVEEWCRKGIAWRAVKIAKFWKESMEPTCVVLDDLPIFCGGALVQTDPKVGLTTELADEVIRRLTL